MGNLDFLGTSGRNIHDIMLSSRLTEEAKDAEQMDTDVVSEQNPLPIMKHLLETRHICPTAPDTLRCFPFRDIDPFVIEEGPHVFFAGC